MDVISEWTPSLFNKKIWTCRWQGILKVFSILEWIDGELLMKIELSMWHVRFAMDGINKIIWIMQNLKFIENMLLHCYPYEHLQEFYRDWFLTELEVDTYFACCRLDLYFPHKILVHFKLWIEILKLFKTMAQKCPWTFSLIIF